MLRKVGGSSLILGIALFTAVTVSASAQSGTGNEPGNVKGQSRSLLFVQNARGGTFTRIRGKSGGFRLTLHGVDPKVVFFSDRPVRDTGLLPQKRLISLLWGPGDPPPNAAVEVLGGDKSQDTLAVKLKNPRFNARKRTLTYEASLLHNLTPTLRHYRKFADRRLPRRFGDVSVFIDSASGGNTCEADVINRTEGWMSFKSGSIWSTDDWEFEPSGEGIPNDGVRRSAGTDEGGFARGCSMTTTWWMPDGSILTITTSDPYTGSNQYTCSPANPAKYSCTLNDGDSVVHGPDLIATWNVNDR